MDKTKVIHIITRFDKGGSAENTCLTIMGLARRNYDVLLIAGSSHESTIGDRERAAVEQNVVRIKETGIRFFTIDTLVRNVSIFKDLATLFKLIILLRRERPHIVHTHTSKAGILGRWAAWLTNVPVIVHTPHGHVFWGYFSRFTSALYAFAEKITGLFTDKIIVLTEQEKRDHLHMNIAPSDKFAIIHSGVDLARFMNPDSNALLTKGDLCIPEGRPVIGTVGRLTAVKGHRYILEAAHRLKNVRPECFFVIVGDGELMGELRKMAVRFDIDNSVMFLGWRPDVASIISTFDIFVFPSLNEGMGKALVEAMAMGIPVIASRVGGIVSLINDEENGILVPPADARALHDGILRLLSDPEERNRMGNNGQSRAAYYDAPSMVRHIDNLYRELFSMSSDPADDSPFQRN